MSRPSAHLNTKSPTHAQVSNWGNYPVVRARVLDLTGDDTADQVNLEQLPSFIPRGMGRCYGDSALGDAIAATSDCSRVVHFDDINGILNCDAGFTIADVLESFVPKGWFPPVTPGTKFVTLGGAIASDVHGKNHHGDGCISEHVLDFRLLTPAGECITCSRTENPEIFWATVGGMGLTGIVRSVRIKLKRITSAFITQRAIKADTLDELVSLFRTHAGVPYSVAWIDTLQRGRHLGRSILLLGEHEAGAATDHSLTSARRGGSLVVPFNLPSFTLNRLTIGAFNWLFYHKQLRADVTNRLHYEPYFYPLDKIHHWNRIYGKRGFTQYQFVVPFEAGAEAIRACLTACNDAGFGSFLSVLKAMGAPNEGLLSFPIEGLTLTLDLPIGPALFPLLDRLDAIVVAHGGRVYLTKDVRLPRAMFDRMYPMADMFRELRERIDPRRRIQSLQSRRLGI